MSLLQQKLRAFAIHFVVTLALAAIAAGLIFFVWFPEPFDDMVGGTKLFLLVTGCDLALGPLISLVIYNNRKSRRELVTDYTIVGLVQLAALIYGVYAVSLARPVYVAFVQDRFEVIAAAEIAPEELAAARSPEFMELPKYGPVLIGTRVEDNERNDALDGAIAGREISMRPKFYVDYEAIRANVKARAQSVDTLLQKHPEARASLESLLKDIDKESKLVRWLPVKHARGFWTALVDPESGSPIAYLPLDPY